MKLQLNPDWTEFLSLLISKHVRFVLVGGHAVAAHGEPRLTEDLDVFVDPTLANAARLREALLAFGFGSDVPSVRELVVPGSIWMLGRKPWRIDVLNKIDGVSFARAWNGRAKADFRCWTAVPDWPQGSHRQQARQRPRQGPAGRRDVGGDDLSPCIADTKGAADKEPSFPIDAIRRPASACGAPREPQHTRHLHRLQS